MSSVGGRANRPARGSDLLAHIETARFVRGMYAPVCVPQLVGLADGQISRLRNDPAQCATVFVRVGPVVLGVRQKERSRATI